MDSVFGKGVGDIGGRRPSHLDSGAEIPDVKSKSIFNMLGYSELLSDQKPVETILHTRTRSDG